MRTTIYKGNGMQLDLESEDNGPVFTHFYIEQFSRSIYRATLEAFEVIKAVLKDEGIKSLYAVVCENDAKHRKFVEMYGYYAYTQTVDPDGRDCIVYELET